MDHSANPLLYVIFPKSFENLNIYEARVWVGGIAEQLKGKREMSDVLSDHVVNLSTSRTHSQGPPRPLVVLSTSK